MTREEDEDIEGGLRKFFRHPKGPPGAVKKLGAGGSENLYTSKPTGEGGGGLLKN